MKPIYVVAAVVEHNNKYLCLQKGKTRFDYTSFKFEFPGGKVEEGETEQEALRRELLEEMDFAVSVERHLVTVQHRYPDFEISLSAWLCTSLSVDFHLKEHSFFCWLSKSELNSLDWAAADVDIVRYLELF